MVTAGADPAAGPADAAAARAEPAAATGDLAVALHQVARAIRTAPQAAGIDLLPPTELDVMRVVASHPGVSVGDAATMLRLRPSNVSAAIRALVARGLVLREPDLHDGRVIRLRATAKAMRHRGLIEAVWTDDLERALVLLEPADLAALLAAADPLARLANALDATRGQPGPAVPPGEAGVESD